MQNIWSVVDLLRRNPHWWSPVTSSAYGINLESRMLDKILYVVITICFIPLLIDGYYHRLLSFFRQFLLIPNRNNKFINRTTNCPTPALINFPGIWTIPGDLWFFCFPIANSNAKALGSGTSGSTVCISAPQTTVTIRNKFEEHAPAEETAY